MADSLRHLKFPLQASLGRRYPEPSHPYRTDFQRDRDRIIHTRAFRRLENKTQVFTPGYSDHFRNRLTHTIEVAQISRTVAGVLELDEDLTEALALGHDIGHPPFAHAGEAELDRQMKRFGDGFNHNLHALRIVETFETRYPGFPGLNLTFEVREGIVKHSCDVTAGEDPELDQYFPDLRPPLEAQLIDLADEIAYNIADLDDAHAAGIVNVEEIAGGVAWFEQALQGVRERYPAAPSRLQFHEALRLLFDELVTALVEGTRRTALAAGVGDHEGVRRHPARLASFTSEAAARNGSLKRFLHAQVYNSPALLVERERTTSRIARLFSFYLDHPDRMPAPYNRQAESEPVHRVVCDYIAGMTDPFFERTYNQILS